MNERTKLIFNAVKEHPDWPSRQIARMIYSQYPDAFTSVEAVRCTIRYFRGSSGNEHRNELIKARGKSF